MSKTRFIGDVHGLKNDLAIILQNIPNDISSVIQVGDLGVGFDQGQYWHNSLDEMLLSVNGRFIRGNHDNPAQCREMKSWIKDGTVENDVMFLGGAWSIDYNYRTLGVDYWQDEELSSEQLYNALDVYNYVQPRVMITHDCPLTVSAEFFIKRGKSFSGVQYKTRTGNALEQMWQSHKPKLHVFGHWHHDVDEVINGTRFICLNEMSYVDINLETLEVFHPTIGF